MFTAFEKFRDFIDAFIGQRALDLISSLVIFVILIGLAWFLWRRRHVAQSSQIRSLETEQLRLTEELAVLLQRYEIALRGSSVTVFTQDRDLRYTSISNPFLGFKTEEIIGRTDDELIPVENRSAVVSMKREVLESREARDRELQINDGQIVRWYDFHIEPLLDNKRRVIGLSCAVVDITASKEGEEHLRLLMRELTHRSKNLLAMIQAIARQTARYAGSIDGFLGQFNARVQALARSHDLLVQEGWHGATLKDLLQSQLGPYVDTEMSQVTMTGPPIKLKPETAQSLGLALHELASNASKYGALSVPTGRIAVTWAPITDTGKRDSGAGKRDSDTGKRDSGTGKRDSDTGKRDSDTGKHDSDASEHDPSGIEILWAEKGGPTVGVPSKRGFGSMVIQNNLARTLDSDVNLTFAEDGVSCLIRVPEAHLFTANAVARQPQKRRGT